MRCTNCDAELAPTARFCTKCGTPVAASPAPAGAAAQPAQAAATTGGQPMSNDPNSYRTEAGQRIDLPSPNVAMRGSGTTGMEYQVIGTTLQAVILELDPGETVYSESGGMAWMSGNIKMETTGRGGG